MKADSHQTRRRPRPSPLRAAVVATLEPLEQRTLLSGTSFSGFWDNPFVQMVLPIVNEFISSNSGSDDTSGESSGDSGEDNSGLGGSDADDDDGDSSGSGSGSGDDDDDDDGEGEDKGHGKPKKPKKVNLAPVAQINAPDASVRGTASVKIVYTDDKKIRAKSVDVGDITVLGPGGVALEVSGVTIDPDKDADTLTATYTLAAPGLRWDSADSGAYTVTLNAGEVVDDKNLPAESISAQFAVNFASLDTAAPTGSIAVENLTSEGGSTHKVTVQYSDDAGVNLQSIGPKDLSITGPRGEQDVRSVDVSPNLDGTEVTATYTFDAPGRAWGPEDNGTYQISLNADQVRDGMEHGATAPPVSFNVSIARPDPIDPGFGSGGGGDSGGGTDAGGGGTDGDTDGGSTGAGGTDGGGGAVSGGAVRADFIAEAVIAQPDGKILVAGRQGNFAGGTSQGVIQRFNADGTLDTSFGTRGKIVTAAGSNDAYYAISLDATGGIVASGMRSDNALVSRFTSSGAPDNSFDSDGHATVDFGGGTDDSAYALGVNADGSIVIAAGPGGNFAIAKLLASGARDAGFGQGGVQMFDLGAADDMPGAIAFQESGKIVIAGTSGGMVAVVRLRASGEADSSFSGDGLLLLDGLAARTGDANFTDRSTGIAVQADGKLLLANRSTGGDFAIARLNTNGAFDSTFGTGGIKTVDFGGDDDADAVLVQDTGEILVIGTSNAGGVATTAVAALAPDGSLIGDFGTGGTLKLTTDLSSSARELHLGDLVLRAFGTRQPDGRIVVGSTNSNPVTVPTRPDQQPGNNTGGGSNGGGSSLRRLNVPGTRTQPLGTLLGTFGVAGGQRTNFTTTDSDGTRITFSASRGTGTVYTSGGKYNLVLSDGPSGAAVVVRTSGGDGRVRLGDVAITGTLRSFNARTADLSGTLYASGAIVRLALGDLTGTVAAAGVITFASLRSMIGARVMSGVSLGADGKTGGTGAEADSFTPGAIGAVRVAGEIEASTICAGLDPVDGVFNNDDDRILGGEASAIRTVSAKSADPASRFIAGKISSLRLGGAIDVFSDERVRILE